MDVVNKVEPDKLCVVFDCASRFQGESEWRFQSHKMARIPKENRTKEVLKAA